MNSTPRIRMVVAASAAVALLGAGAATAVAAPHSGQSAPAHSAPSAAKTNTVTADKTHVKPWEEFRLTGKVTGITSGTSVHIQQKQGAKWVTLPGTSVVNKTGGYSIRVKLGMKGPQQVRTLVDKTPSNAVAVTVR